MPADIVEIRPFKLMRSCLNQSNQHWFISNSGYGIDYQSTNSDSQLSVQVLHLYMGHQI